MNKPKSFEDFFCRDCSECSAGMDEGFVIQDGEAYYCSTKCLNVNMTDEEYTAQFEAGEPTYWAQWDKEYEFEEYLKEVKK